VFGERRSERFKHVTEGRLDSARMAAQNTRQHSSQTVLCPPEACCVHGGKMKGK